MVTRKPTTRTKAHLSTPPELAVYFPHRLPESRASARVLRHDRRLGGEICARRLHQAEVSIPAFFFMWPLWTLRLPNQAPGPTTVPGDPILCAGSSAATSPSSGLPTSSATPPPSVGSASPSSCARPRHSASVETGARASRPRYSVAFRCPRAASTGSDPSPARATSLWAGLYAASCPSCAQKRTLLPGEYLRENLLLRLPHRQAVQWPAIGFVWTIPKVLRVFLRHDRDLFADIGRLLFDILSRFFNQAAGRTLRCAMVCSHQTFGEFSVWHPHWHSIVMEGGFDRHDRFFFIPLGATDAFSEIWRRSV